MPRSWTAQEVAEVVTGHPEWLGTARAVGEPMHAGSGESYEAWLAGPAGPLLRCARRPIGELPADPAEEVAGMRLAPPGVGPRPIGSDIVRVDGRDYPVLAQDFLPGRVLAPADWTTVHREGLARQLAALHTVTYSRPGGVRQVTESAGAAGRGSIDFAADVEGIIDFWTPRVAGTVAEEWLPLCAPMRTYAASLSADFAAMQEFSLIHGDPCLTNIVVSGDDWPVLIDWEWTRIGDPARDLAFLGGAVHADPWYAAMTDAEITRFLQAYVGAGGRGEIAALRRRRDAWLAAEGFAVLAYLLWVDADPEQTSTPANRAAAAGLRRTVTAYLAAW